MLQFDVHGFRLPGAVEFVRGQFFMCLRIARYHALWFQVNKATELFVVTCLDSAAGISCCL